MYGVQIAPDETMWDVWIGVGDAFHRREPLTSRRPYVPDLSPMPVVPLCGGAGFPDT